MSKQITVEQIDAAIEQVVKERGEDWVYPEYTPENEDWYINGLCRNIKPDGTPACIVGSLFHAIDPTLLKPETSMMGAADTLRDLAKRGIISQETQEAVAWPLERAQMIQDDHETWGKALNGYQIRRDLARGVTEPV